MCDAIYCLLFEQMNDVFVCVVSEIAIIDYASIHYIPLRLIVFDAICRMLSSGLGEAVLKDT